MCGINGIFAYRDGAPPVDEAELLRIREAMAKRGPDGAGLWISPDRRVGLAHRRLTIIDLSDAAAQPMATTDGRLHITFNGEIYNYKALRKELEQKGFVFRSQSDTEVLLHLYADRGAEMVHALRGMYAFGIWDVRDKTLFLARDPFGIKPLYYSDNGSTLRFASQVRALVAGRAVSTDMEAAGYAGFFLWGSVPEPYTLFRAIRAIPAGHWLRASAKGVGTPREYYSLRAIFAESERRQETTLPDGGVEEIRNALEDSVKYHQVADVPVGVFLSAGLDSAMLAGSAARTGSLRSITLGFDEFRGTALDETSLAEATARAFGTRHETKWITYDRFNHETSRFLDSMDQPSIDGLNTYFVSACAREAGMKVALSGIGGDELLGGYPSFRQVPRIARLFRVAQTVPVLARAMRRVADPLLRPFASPKYAGLAEYGTTLAGAYLLRRALFMPWELPRLLDPDIAEAGLAELATVRRLGETIAGISNRHAAVACLEMSWYMRNQLLRDADWAGMAHSLEIRVPLVDVELVRRVSAVIASGTPPGKPAVAAALCPSIPRQALHRGKTGFAVPIRQWLARADVAAASARGMRGWASRVFAGIRQDRRFLLLATDLYGRTGGIAQFNRDLVRALCAHPSVSRLDALARNGGSVPADLPARLRLWCDAMRGLVAYVRSLGRALFLQRREFELIVCGHLNLLPLAWLAKQIRGGKLLLVLHGIEAWKPTRRPLVKLLLPAVDAIASVSRVTFERFDGWARGVGARRFLLPDCIDLERFTPGPRDPQIVQRHGLRGARVLFTLGRFETTERYKGVDEILEVLPAVLGEAPDIVYLVAGDGTDLPRLREKAAKLRVDDRIRFAGRITEEEKVAYYRSVDAFAMPGRGEGFGIVYLEAAACGLPTIGSALDASREALLDGRLGEVIDPDDRGALKGAILRAVSAARRVPEGIEYYSFPRFAERCDQMVDNLLGAQGVTP